MMVDSDQVIEATGTRRGRPRAIPQAHFETILKLYDSGLGYRSITRQLWGLGVTTTHTTVRRLIKGEGAYAECVTCHGARRSTHSKARPSAGDR